jgi:hypothetical protein
MDEAEILIQSGDWLTNEATDIIKKYKECKTEHARAKLIPKMEYIRSRLAFEKRQFEQIFEI